MTRVDDVLAFLADSGPRLAEQAPRLAGALREASLDPDAERIIEGVAHLAAQVDATLSSGLTRILDLGQAIFFPDHARPFPACSVARLDSPQPILLPRGTRIAARSPDGLGPCTFSTLFDADGGPLRLERLRAEAQSGRTTLDLSLAQLPLDADLPDRLRLHLSGEPNQAFVLHQTLARSLESAEWLDPRTGASLGACPEIGAEALGLGERDGFVGAAEPGATDLGDPLGWSRLRTWLCFPASFCFLDLGGAWSSARRLGVPASGATLRLRLGQELPRAVGVSADAIALHATPIVNLFRSDADPVLVGPYASLLDVRAARGEELERIRRLFLFGPHGRRAVPLVEQLTGRDHASRAEFAQTFTQQGARGQQLHRLHLERRAVPDATETLSVEILATNGSRPRYLRVGEPLTPERWRQDGAFTLLSAFVGPHAAPRGEEARRSLVRLLAVATSGLDSVDALRNLLSTQHLAALELPNAARELALLHEALCSLTTTEAAMTVDGAPVQAVRRRVVVDEGAFASAGELTMLGSLLDLVLAAQAGLNTLSVLEIEEKKTKKVHRWPKRLASRTIRDSNGSSATRAR